eukprot:gb/GECG01010061.1/.p1 GENE.gb/GECG01010061.1/~~gb/GECG01010061.1/.p1  ORF type:complete len:105 (+),score=14.45 gb/GECG01010061.1/:1-315(+)
MGRGINRKKEYVAELSYRKSVTFTCSCCNWNSSRDANRKRRRHRINKKTSYQQQFTKSHEIKNGPKPSGKQLRKIARKQKIQEGEKAEMLEYVHSCVTEWSRTL